MGVRFQGMALGVHLLAFLMRLGVDCEGGCSGVKHSVVSVKLKSQFHGNSGYRLFRGSSGADDDC